jgi:hypothetical protein
VRLVRVRGPGGARHRSAPAVARHRRSSGPVWAAVTVSGGGPGRVPGAALTQLLALLCGTGDPQCPFAPASGARRAPASRRRHDAARGGFITGGVTAQELLPPGTGTEPGLRARRAPPVVACRVRQGRVRAGRPAPEVVTDSEVATRLLDGRIRPDLVDMWAIVSSVSGARSASITHMIRHYVARQGAGDRRSPA